MELNLVVGKINFVLAILFHHLKNSKCLHLNIKAFFKKTNTITWPSTSFQGSINSTKMPTDLAYKGFITKFTWLSEVKWAKMVINLCTECLLISMTDYSLHNHDKDIIFRNSWLYKLPFIRLHAFIICFTINYKCS